VKFEVQSPGFSRLQEDASLVIWTTTPWTLPANLGIALHPEFDYTAAPSPMKMAAVKSSSSPTHASRPSAASTGFKLDTTHAHDQVQRQDASNGARLSIPSSRAPRRSSTPSLSPTTPAPAPSTWPLATARTTTSRASEHGLDILSPVDDAGKFTAECGLPDFVGQHVFKSNEGIIAILEGKGAILGNEKYVHQYPHCWRSKTPIIFRAVEQFFIRIAPSATKPSRPSTP
jgi:isoleucyl-tRNA synthetase